jgi:AAA+ ATPase superfamily predicted ATPase
MATRDYRESVAGFVDSGVGHHTLGLVYGRRRIGKSTLLEGFAHERSGFYWEATRKEAPLQLADLGEAIGAYLGVGRIALDSWDDAFAQLLQLGVDDALPVVLDEFGYVLEADSSADSVLAAAVGPRGRRGTPGQARLILCGSAIAMMRSLTAGQAPLRGRAGMELVMQAADFREAAHRLGDAPDLDLATRVFAVIGGVIGYATDMVDNDLPDGVADFHRWVAARLLSPAATLHN